MNKKVIFLRAYHPTYMVCYFGNQDIASKDHNKDGFEFVYKTLKENLDTVIELTKEFDDICQGCKKLKPDSQGSVWGKDRSCSSSADEKVVADVYVSSLKVLKMLGLDYGAKISRKELVNLLREHIPYLEDPMLGGPNNQKNYEKGFERIKALIGS